MKNRFSILLFVAFCTTLSFAQNRSIEFEHGTFAELLAKAKKEYKMINPANRADKATNKVSVAEEAAIYREIRKLATQCEDQTAIILNNGPDEVNVMEDFNATFQIF